MDGVLDSSLLGGYSYPISSNYEGALNEGAFSCSFSSSLAIALCIERGVKGSDVSDVFSILSKSRFTLYLLEVLANLVLSVLENTAATGSR